MYKDLITLNEVLNSGSSIDLYQEENTGLWATYGYSAYLLFHQNGIQCQANFSIHMQMPCVCITEADLKRLVTENPQTIEANDGYYHLSTESRIDAASYRIWENSLKIKSTGNERTIANLYARSDRLVLYLLDISLYPESSQNKEYRR